MSTISLSLSRLSGLFITDVSALSRSEGSLGLNKALGLITLTIYSVSSLAVVIV